MDGVRPSIILDNRKEKKKIEIKMVWNQSRPSPLVRRRHADEEKKKEEEVINFQLSASLRQVSIAMMTSAANFSRLATQNLTAEVIVTPSCTRIAAQLKEFKVFDCSTKRTRYPMIVESTDTEVFDLAIVLNDEVSQRDRERGMPDVHVRLKMGQIRLVFLMKYVKDLLGLAFNWQLRNEPTCRRRGNLVPPRDTLRGIGN